MQTPQSAQTETSEKCSIVEILQYTCELGATHEGKPEVRCIPVPRLFRMQVFYYLVLAGTNSMHVDVLAVRQWK